jgi:predicted metalloprotease
MGGPAMVGGGVGIVGVVIAVLFSLLGGGTGGPAGLPIDLGPLGAAPAAQGSGVPVEDEAEEFVGFVIDDAQDTWEQIFAGSGERYERTEVVLFDSAVSTGGCGNASSAVGPFYCPADGTVYIDLGFFDELQARFDVEGSGADTGSFAQAYVIAHEVGHHVQNLLGVSDEVAQRLRDGEGNELSIRTELQADCFAGVWGYSAMQEDRLTDADIAQALDAAAAVGDDRIQESTTGRVDRESWTHGSAEQRTRWFTIGFESGDPSRCDTFSADEL